MNMIQYDGSRLLMRNQFSPWPALPKKSSCRHGDSSPCQSVYVIRVLSCLNSPTFLSPVCVCVCVRACTCVCVHLCVLYRSLFWLIGCTSSRPLPHVSQHLFSCYCDAHSRDSWPAFAVATLHLLGSQSDASRSKLTRGG